MRIGEGKFQQNFRAGGFAFGESKYDATSFYPVTGYLATAHVVVVILAILRSV